MKKLFILGALIFNLNFSKVQAAPSEGLELLPSLILASLPLHIAAAAITGNWAPVGSHTLLAIVIGSLELLRHPSKIQGERGSYLSTEAP